MQRPCVALPRRAWHRVQDEHHAARRDARQRACRLAPAALRLHELRPRHHAGTLPAVRGVQPPSPLRLFPFLYRPRPLRGKPRRRTGTLQVGLPQRLDQTRLGRQRSRRHGAAHGRSHPVGTEQPFLWRLDQPFPFHHGARAGRMGRGAGSLRGPDQRSGEDQRGLRPHRCLRAEPLSYSLGRRGAARRPHDRQVCRRGAGATRTLRLWRMRRRHRTPLRNRGAVLRAC